MDKHKILLISLINIILIFSLSSCVTDSKMSGGDYPIINVDVDFESATDNVSLFFDNYKYVTLQSNDSLPLGNIELFDMRDDKYVIVSRNIIHVYGNDGTELSCFDKKGNGPGEYIEVQDISMGEKGIYVLSWSQKKIILYDLDGKCLETYTLPYSYAAICRNNDDNIWLASESDNDSKYEFSLYDTWRKEIIENYIPFEQNQSTYSSIRIFNPFVFTSDKEILLSKQYDYKIYGIRQNGEYIAWEYSFNTEKQIEDFGKNLNYVDLYQSLSNQPVIMWPGLLWKGNENVYQTLGVFYIMGRFTNIYKFSIYHPERKGELLHIGLKSYKEFPFLRNSVLDIKNGWYISTMPLSEALKISKDNNISLDYKEVTSDDAQVLFFHHFRD